MVANFLTSSQFLLAQADGKRRTLLEQLDPRLRFLVLMALLGIVLIAIILVLFIWLWGRHVRRMARRRTPTRHRDPSDWDRKQPVGVGDDTMDEADSDENSNDDDEFGPRT